MESSNSDVAASSRDLSPAPAPSIALHTPGERASSVAPWWHTVLLVLLIGATSFVGSRKHGGSAPAGGGRVRLYSLTIAWEWLMAGIVLWGIRLRKVPLRQLLGERRQGLKTWFADLRAALAFWFMTIVMLAAVSAMLDLVHVETAKKAIVKLGPTSALEMLLWIGLSVTAGICEELIFRGYLQQQFAGINGRLWVGVACSAVIFGGAHGYEGAGGMIAITAFGAMLSVVAVRRGSLRPCMMMHAWHDIFSGTMLFLLKHAHRI